VNSLEAHRVENKWSIGGPFDSRHLGFLWKPTCISANKMLGNVGIPHSRCYVKLHFNWGQFLAFYIFFILIYIETKKARVYHDKPGGVAPHNHN
jgi:hypothetical protein